MTFRHTLSTDQHAEMRRLRIEEKLGRQEIAAKMGTSVRTVSRILADVPMFRSLHNPEPVKPVAPTTSAKARIAARFAPGCQPRYGR